MISGNRNPFSLHEPQNGQDDKEEQRSLGGNQVEPVEGRGNRVELDSSLDPFDFHDDGSADIATKPEQGRKNMTFPDADEVRVPVVCDQGADLLSDGRPVFAASDVPGGDIAGES